MKEIYHVKTIRRHDSHILCEDLFCARHWEVACSSVPFESDKFYKVEVQLIQTIHDRCCVCDPLRIDDEN